VPHDSDPASSAPEASVIIACRGRVADLLAEQLSALADQDFADPWELLIADNGISAGVRQLIHSYADRLPAVRIIDARDRAGRSYAINHAVQAARSERLVFLDSDDVVAPDYLREIVAALSEHEFVGTRLDSVALNPSWLQSRRRPLQESQLEALIGAQPTVIGAGMGLQRSAFDKVEGFDEDLLTLEDMDISIRLDQVGVRPFFAAAAIVRYRYRSELLAIFNQERSYSRGAAQLHQKHRGLLRSRGPRQTLRGILDLLLALPQARDRAGRARLATTLGAAVGRIEGSLTYRIFYL
jgi:GT2 family glycosyltransferase